LPNPKVRLPSVFGFSTFKQAVLQQFEKPIKANLARSRDPHALEPNANREPAIQGEPNENSNLARARAVPNSGQHLAICQIVKIELLDEGTNYRDLGRSPKVHISMFN